MSEGQKVTLAKAQRLGERVIEVLRPYVSRVEFAGSIRRERAHVSDVEIVLAPRMEPEGLLGESGPSAALEGIRLALARFGRLVKNGDRYIQVAEAFKTDAFDGMKVDVFMVHPPAQWGVIFAIRTGPADLSELVVTKMKRRGFRTVDGHVELVSTGKVVETPSEDHFFACAGLPCLEPHHRDLPSARIQNR